MKNYDKEIAELEEKLEALKEKKRQDEKAKKISPEKYFAEKLHECRCKHNHTDGCGWYYEGDNWEGNTHARWLNKATELLTAINGRIPMDEFLEIVDNLLP